MPEQRNHRATMTPRIAARNAAVLFSSNRLKIVDRPDELDEDPPYAFRVELNGPENILLVFVHLLRHGLNYNHCIRELNSIIEFSKLIEPALKVKTLRQETNADARLPEGLNKLNYGKYG